MKEQGYITEEEYTIAMNDNVYDRIAMHTQSQAESAPYSYFIDEVITNLINDLMVQKGYTEVQAKNVVYSGGLKIYTTQDSYMQSILDTEFQNPENFPANTQIGLDWALTVEQADGEVQNYSKEMLQLYFRNSDPNFDLLFDSQEEAQSYIDQYKAAIMQEGDTIVAERSSFTPQPQACMTVMDQRTGYVKAIVGGRGEKTASLTFNRATDNYSQPGSTFKILSAYGPALDLGKITLATVIKDEPFNYSDGTPLQNSDLTYHGDVTVRQAIINSINIPAVKVLTELTPKVGFDYLKKLGFSKLSEEYDVIQPLALGGITYGVSDLELTAAYAAIADGGQYRKPVFYTKVTDSKGNVLIDNTENKATQVFKASTASLLTNVMEDVLEKGTGVAARLDNMHAAGKTGTTNEAKDLVFAGFTPYYTAAIWATYDTHAEFPESDREFHKRLWAKVMNEIHEALPIWISKLPQQYRRQRSVRRPACSPAQAARPSPNTLRYPICRPSVARATTPRRPQHRRRPEPLLQHQLRRQPRHRRRHRRKLRLRPKHLPIRLLIHRRLLTHRIPLMHRQNRIPRRRYRKYSRSPKRAALPNNFFSQSIHKNRPSGICQQDRFFYTSFSI